VINIFGEKKAALKDRLKRYTNLSRYTTLSSQQINNGAINESYFDKKSKKDNVSFIRLLGKTFISNSVAKRMETQLIRAEIPMRGEEFLVIIGLGILLSGFIGLFILGGLGPAAVLMSLVGILPFIMISSRKKKRFVTLNSQIGESLTVMANSLRAGYSFQQAMDLAAKEMSGPLSVEFKRTVREINLGITIDEALGNLNKRVKSDDLELVITAVLIQRQIGGNLAEIFSNISYTIQERIRIKGEIRTLTAQGRMSGIVIGLLPPGLFAVLMLINPAYMGVLLTDPTGIMILTGGITSEIIGVLVIKKIISIDV